MLNGVGDNAIFIGQNTSFKGTITAKKVAVEGFVDGDIIASERVFIKRGGVVNGNICTQKFLCEEGGQHDGLIQLEQQPLPTNTAIESSTSNSKRQNEDQSQKEQKPSTSKPKEKGNIKRLW